MLFNNERIQVELASVLLLVLRILTSSFLSHAQQAPLRV